MASPRGGSGSSAQPARPGTGALGAEVPAEERRPARDSPAPGAQSVERPLGTDGVLTDTARVHAAAWARLFDGYLERRPAPL